MPPSASKPERPWPKVLYARKRVDWICEPRLSTVSGDGANEPDLEEETYIPVSALLSDEAILAAKRVCRERGAAVNERILRDALQAAIEQVGGAERA